AIRRCDPVGTIGITCNSQAAVLAGQRSVLPRDLLRVERRLTTAQHVADEAVPFVLVPDANRVAVVPPATGVTKTLVLHALLRWQLRRPRSVDRQLDQILGQKLHEIATELRVPFRNRRLRVERAMRLDQLRRQQRVECRAVTLHNENVIAPDAKMIAVL